MPLIGATTATTTTTAQAVRSWGQPQPSPPQPAEWRRLAWGLVVAFLVAMAAVGLALAYSLRRQPASAGLGTSPPVPLGEVIPSQVCIPLSPEEIRNGTFNAGTTLVQLKFLRATMVYHMQQNNMSAICAQFLLYHRVCYCLLNTGPDVEDTSHIKEMYNMAPLGRSPLRFKRTTERMPFCKNPHVAYRYDRFTVHYLDDEGELQEYEGRGIISILLQQMDQVQRGEGVCEDTNAEVMMARADRTVRALGRRFDGEDSGLLQLPSH